MSAGKKKKSKKKRKASTTLKRYPYSDSNQKFSAEDLEEYFRHRQYSWDSDEDLAQYFDNYDEDQNVDDAYDSEEYFGMHGEK